MLLNIDGNSEAISDYERRMRIMENVLRYMTIRVEEHEEGDSIMFSNKSKDGDNVYKGGPKENHENIKPPASNIVNNDTSVNSDKEASP